MPALVAVRPEGDQDAAALFSDESSEGLAFTWERQYELAQPFSDLFAALSNVVAPALERRGVPAKASSVVAREICVPLSYTYFDRLLRLEAFAAKGGSWSVARAPRIDWPAEMVVLRSDVIGSPALNHAVLERLAPVVGLPVVDSSSRSAATIFKKPQTFANRNFVPSTFAQKVRRVARIAWNKANGPAKPVPCLSLGYSLDAFKNAGFLGTYLEPLVGKLGLSGGERDENMRLELSNALLAAGEAAERFLRAAGSKALANKATAGFASFAAEVCPTSVLEAAHGNTARCVEALKPFAPRPVLIGERADLESLFVIAAARVLGMEAVNFQHGGHIGYVIGQTNTCELEELMCDRFVTWGWTEFPKYPRRASPPATALPNPWLSERAKRWRKILPALPENRAHDFLLFTNRVHRFPGAPSGPYQLTSDYLPAFRAMLVSLAREAKRRGAKILHKPYNLTIASVLSATLDDMKREGGDCYSEVERLDKGLSPELLAQARVVLWDQPGTGFLECLASGIPTMCYWTRLYNREEPAAAEPFARLEKAGIVHRELKSLFDALDQLKMEGLEAWRAEPERLKAVNAFARAYGWADDGWEKAWAEFLLS
jgi:hypothetical protein